MAQQLDIDPLCSPGLDVVAAAGSDPEEGLTSAEAAFRLAEDGPNELVGQPPVPGWRRFLAQFNSPLIYLLLAAIVISATVWALAGPEPEEPVPVDAIVILVIVLLNAVLGYLQEAKAADAVGALRELTKAHSQVIRNGQRLDIISSELVLGDILLLSEGDAVGADARLLSASALRMAEASLTGESAPVGKDPAILTGKVALGDRTNMVYRGTAVTQGTGKAVVTATGMATEVGGIATMLDATEKTASPLSREISHLGRLLGLLVIGIAAIVMATALYLSPNRDLDTVLRALILAVSLAVAAVPEGLAAILTVVLSLGVRKMAQRNAIVTDLNSVETLGSASVIASDKTGTLTRNEMTVEKVVTSSGAVQLTGAGYDPQGEARLDIASPGRPVLDTDLLAEVRLVLRGGAIANDADLRRDADGWAIQGDPTEAAFLVAAHKVGVNAEADAHRRLASAPFTSARKMMSVIAQVGEDAPVLYAKGAPDVVLAACTRVLVGEQEEPLDESNRQQLLKTADELAGRAYRTLAVAFGVAADDAGSTTEIGEAEEANLCYAGVVAMIDQPRPEAAQAIAQARGAGIRVLMITGDHPATAARIASDLGIAATGDPVVTGAELDWADDEQLTRLVHDHSVYARVAPRHKLRIIDALHRQKEIVAMTGDGVNDAPALKAADIGVAMGITGTDVTKQAATMVLADDNFATIVAAIEQGRLIFDNIRKFLRFLLSSNMGEVVTVFLGTVLAGVLGLRDETGGLVAPLLATQILWINLLTDSAPALAMGVDPAVDDVMARAPRSPTQRVITTRMWWRIVVQGLVMGLATLLTYDWFLPGGLFDGDQSHDLARTAAFTTLVLAQLFNAFNARSDHTSAFHDAFSNKWLWAAVGMAFALQVLVVHVGFMQTAFSTTALDWRQWLVCLAAASVVLWFVELDKLVIRLTGRGGDDS